jgi:hypothetical protein
MLSRRSTFIVALSFAGALGSAGCSSDATEASSSSEDELRGATSMISLLAQVPAGTAWKDVKPSIRARLARNAEAFYAKQRHDWGVRGLDEKEERILDAPTAAITTNFDLILKFVLSPDIPETFTPSTDITNPELAKQMRRFYLAYIASNRHQLLTKNPAFKDWDGGDVTDLSSVYEPSVTEAFNSYAGDVEKKILALPASSLTAVEAALIRKAAFTARAIRTNRFNYTGTAPEKLYDLMSYYPATPKAHIFKDDEDFLLTMNAVTFGKLAFMNVGTVDAFNWDYDGLVDPGYMQELGLDPASVAGKSFLTLAGWWKERVNAHADADKKCTIYSKADRRDIWDNFTARQRTNADGSETFENYGASYDTTVAARLVELKAVATGAVDAAFDATSPLVTPAQKADVLAAIQAETRPAAVLETIYAALDRVTGGTAASTALKAEFANLEMVGGYAAGEAIRPADVATVNAMWAEVKAYLASQYGGLTVDISALAPATLVVTTGSASTAASTPSGPVINIGLKTKKSKVTLYSTLLHEGKHAIDFASHASVQGSAWEGAAVLVETMVLPKLLDQVMSTPDAKRRIPFYRLGEKIDSVKLTSTTDATLKVFLRSSCGNGQPDSIAFAKGIVKSYGYTDEPTLIARSQRAHFGSQYLEYEYGQVQYAGIVSWFQGQIGSARTIDPYVLQGCGMPSPARDAAAVAKLKTCLGL